MGFATERRTSKLHVAIIMDGNGRWAQARGLPRTMGHRAGAATVRKIVRSAPDAGIETLTLYAFSSDNWRRPAHEVRAVLALAADYLRREASECVRNGVKLTVIGRRDRVPAGVVKAIDRAERMTRGGKTLHLRIALDYSARDAIFDAASRIEGPVTRDEFARMVTGGAPDVDLLLRTGGEQRMSDFLLWECAYAELLFVEKLWPDFSPKDLMEAVAVFHARVRKFGGLPHSASARRGRIRDDRAAV